MHDHHSGVRPINTKQVFKTISLWANLDLCISMYLAMYIQIVHSLVKGTKYLIASTGCNQIFLERSP